MPVKRSATPLTARQGYKNKGSVPFKKGNPGRPHGAKDKGPIPKNIRASVKAICQQVALKNRDTIERALLNGISASPAHADRYVRLVAEYVDGRPVDTMHLNATLVQEEISSAKNRLTKSISTLATAAIRRRTRRCPGRGRSLYLVRSYGYATGHAPCISGIP